MIGRMLHGIPTKPVLVIAPLVIVVILAIYYYEKYSDCTRSTSLREQLYTELRQNIGRTLSLADILPIEWDQAAILKDYQPAANSKLPDCPFDWGWNQSHRQTLAGQNQLNIIVFFRDEQFIDYVEFRRDVVDFGNVNNPYSAETARFEVNAPASDNGPILLRESEQG